ncbi:cache domain-containing protein [Desulfobacter vibrioformis]|uniref:cache domain-containing protein n=1 Tax=Desulfobacter vibrioformis TaxID=34031 RepID=UPI0005576F2A|nr:cache domain-containing protein [Desulfobacter vibrioformis]
MAADMGAAKRFSIFDPSIQFEHREFYERIVSELNGIFPVCNQGESTAMEISANPTEQEQITELMKRVENFSRELLDVTKKLFDQYYVAKEQLHASILHTTAYNKINTLDRNLLERTCDVRWWALETAFSNCIQFYEETRKEASDIFRLLEGISEASSDADDKALERTSQEISFSNQLERIKGGLENFSGLLKQNALEDFISAFNELNNCLDSTSTANVGKTLKSFLKRLIQLASKIEFACCRLEDINNSYTLYRDLVIADSDGFIIANANSERRLAVLGLCVKEEAWFVKALDTKNGTEYFAQDIYPSNVEDQLSLVYSTAVRENSDENDKVSGAMGVFFDFQGEAQIILEEYMPMDEAGQILDGCYSMFTNSRGKIIASTDENILEIGESAHLPKRNRTLNDGESMNSYLVFEGCDSAVFSARTDGYLDYRGLGWSSHVIIPKSHIFENSSDADIYDISAEELLNSKIIPDINKQTYRKVQDDKESIQLISLNGIVFASKLGKRGGALGPIFNQITKSGDYVTSRMEDLLKEMANAELQLNLKALENFSKQAIDLIDRNLFERSADIRWWATDEYFWTALLNPTEENFIKAGNRLKVINGSYTMYRNLVLSDANGDIHACSRTELKNELSKINVSDQVWFQMGMRTTLSSEYAVQDVADSNLEKNKERSLIYANGVRRNGEREGDSIGVLGILFDWDTEAKKILHTCLPKDRQGMIIEGSVAIYTNNQSEIIETTDAERFPVGMKLDLPDQIFDLKAGDTVSGLLEYQEKRYIFGSSKTKGYREYEGLGWFAHVLRPIF